MLFPDLGWRLSAPGPATPVVAPLMTRPRDSIPDPAGRFGIVQPCCRYDGRFWNHSIAAPRVTVAVESVAIGSAVALSATACPVRDRVLVRSDTALLLPVARTVSPSRPTV